MSKKLLIIYPRDPTTSFLTEIIDYFDASLQPENLLVKIVEPDKESHENCLNFLNEGQFDILLFLGHGSSRGVQGASNANYKHELLITSDELPLLKGKTCIFLSCNSNDFLKKGKDFSFIGFGNMPTDWNDIMGTREVEPNAYKGITEETIGFYKSYLCHIIKAPIFNLITDSNYNLKKCFFDIEIRINKLIASNYKDERQFELAYLMYELKSDMAIKT